MFPNWIIPTDMNWIINIIAVSQLFACNCVRKAEIQHVQHWGQVDSPLLPLTIHAQLFLEMESIIWQHGEPGLFHFQLPGKHLCSQPASCWMTRGFLQSSSCWGCSWWEFRSDKRYDKALKSNFFHFLPISWERLISLTLSTASSSDWSDNVWLQSGRHSFCFESVCWGYKADFRMRMKSNNGGDSPI